MSELVVRVFFVGLVAFTPTDDSRNGDWLALLVDAQDLYGIAAHAPELYYCEDSGTRCSAVEHVSLRNHRLKLDFPENRTVPDFVPKIVDGCDPESLRMPSMGNADCAQDYRWIVSPRRTFGHDTDRRYCCRSWRVFPPCNSVAYVVLEHGELQNCRFVEATPPTTEGPVIASLSGFGPKTSSRAASEVSMVKIKVLDWSTEDHLAVKLAGVSIFHDDEDDIVLHGAPCDSGTCIDLLVDNRPPPLYGLPYRPLIAGHFDAYRTVFGKKGAKVMPRLNPGLTAPIGLQPCGDEESPLLIQEVLLAGGNERPICPEVAVP